jgi:hypothetical protein
VKTLSAGLGEALSSRWQYTHFRDGHGLCLTHLRDSLALCMAILSHIYTYTKLNKIKKHSEENAKF